MSDSIHCRTPDSTQVVVVDLPEAQFEVAVSDLCSPTITLTPTSPGIDSWEWQVRGDLTLNSTDQNLEIQLTESVQTLEVRLTVNNEWCSASETKFLDSLTHMVNLIVLRRERVLNLTPQYARFQSIKRTLLSKSTR